VRRLGLAAALAASVVLFAAPPAALAHGGEEEAAAEAPARTLVQQALALLTQADNPTEATEKLEAALQSEDREGVDIAAVRKALAALENDDHELAVDHLNTALGAGEAPEAPAEGAAPDEAAPTGEKGEHEGAEPAEGAFEHAEELEPDQGTAEWVALVVGVVLAAGALALLASRRGAA
jgi:hypothetical protein